MPPRTEGELLDQVINLAMLNRWAVTHFRAAQTRNGWRTAIQGHKGYPDITLARSGLVLFRELKDPRGTLEPEQLDWARQISGDPHWSEPAKNGARYADRFGLVFDVWRPADMMGLIVPTLKQPRCALTGSH